MIDGLHIRNRTMKPILVALSGAGRKWRGDGGGDLTNVQCKSIWNCCNDSPHTMNIS
jgi:hypothetical protein